MKKIIVFTDVHGNYDALNMLMNTDDFKTADLRVFLGDAVVMGPYPNECCKALIDTGCIWLMGNNDSYVANGFPYEEKCHSAKDRIEHQHYMEEILKEEYKDVIKALEKDYLIKVNDKKLYFTHYIWESEENVIDVPWVVTLEHLQSIYKDIEADYIFFGHDHTFANFEDEYKKYVCVGSLGMKHPGHYTVINIGDEIKVEHKYIFFDLEKYKNDIISAGYPGANKYARFFEEDKRK